MLDDASSALDYRTDAKLRRALRENYRDVTTVLIAQRISGSDLIAYFWSALFSSLYSEIMARIRKYPAISYLVISIFPIIPGAGAYYTMNYAVRGEMASFANQGMHTIAIAGIMAVGILLGSTGFRMYSDWKMHRK